jgi:hypothetical protein
VRIGKTEKKMKAIILSAVFAAGLGLAGMGGAIAAPVSNGLNDATTNSSSLLEQIQYRRDRRCRSVQVCRRGPMGGRRCHTERVCR